MDIQEYVTSYLSQTEKIAREVSHEKIIKAIEILRDLRDRKGRLFIIGVGGSAANASHAVNDFRKIAGIESYAPTDNVAELTARTNDEGWGTTFVEWLKVSNLSQNDAVMVFSVGGGSETTSLNIVNALKLAEEKKSKIIGIVSRNGGYTNKVADSCILIPVLDDSRITPHAEGWQGIIWHLIVNAVKNL